MAESSNFNKYFTVFVLTAINLLNYMDRFTIAGILNLLEDKKRNGFSLGEKPESVDDTMGGVLQTAFIVSYMILSPVFGYLGDRYSRKMIISFGILIWAAFTLIGSFSLNYWMLFSTRLLVGVGEASYATISPTMIADLFPAEKRLRMLAIFYTAMPVGSSLGYIVGSGVSTLVFTSFKQADSWRWALRVTPGLGVIAALLVAFVVKEPVRGSTDHRTAKGVKGKSGWKAYLHDLIYLLRNATFVTSTFGFTAVAYATGALAQWAPIFIQRVSFMLKPGHGYGDSTAAIVFGSMAVVAGILGTFIGSELSKLLGRYTQKAEAIMCSASMILGVPFLFLSLVVVQYEVIYISFIAMFMAVLSACLVWTPVSAMLLYTVVPSRRATASSIQILFSHMLGDAVSPTIVGVISDGVYSYIGPFQGYNTGKAVSMEFGLFTTAIMLVLGSGAFLMSTLTVEWDRKAVEIYSQRKKARLQHNSSTSQENSADQERKELMSDSRDTTMDYNA